MISLVTTRRISDKLALGWKDESWWLNFMEEFERTHALSDRWHSNLRLALREWGASLTTTEDDVYAINFENDEDAVVFLMRWS